MADSEVAIANMALDYLGAAAITSMDDESVTAARIKRNFPLVRDAVLRSYPWNCAARRAKLPALAGAPDFGFARAFQLPSDCLRVFAIEDDALYGERWRVEGRQLLTDAGAPLEVRYISRPSDVALLDPMLVDAIAARLAANLCYAVTENATRAQQMAVQAQQIWTAAKSVDAVEASQDERITADLWVNARF